MKISKAQTAAVDPFRISERRARCRAPPSDDIDVAPQLNENLLMPCAAVMMELTEGAELLFVLFRGVLTHVNVPELSVCVCGGVFIRLVSITLKAHYTQFKDGGGIHGRTMENVAAGTNLGIYRRTIKQSCSAGDGTHGTHVPRCVQSHVKTQLTSWQRPPLCFHLPFSAAVPAHPACGPVL